MTKFKDFLSKGKDLAIASVKGNLFMPDENEEMAYKAAITNLFVNMAIGAYIGYKLTNNGLVAIFTGAGGSFYDLVSYSVGSLHQINKESKKFLQENNYRM